MIINRNQVILSDSQLPLEETYISAHTSEISNNSYTAVKVRAQTGFFRNPEKLLESPTNALKIEGYASKNVITFDYPTDDTNVFYFFDVKLKEHLMQCFPYWDADLLEVTTTPTEGV